MSRRPVSFLPLSDFNKDKADYALDGSQLELGALLGKGAFSQVFKAKFRGTDVAVKKQVLVDDLEKYVLKELAVLRRCNHPGLVHYLGSCRTDDNTVLIVTEYLRGGDLRRILQSNRPLGWKLRVELMSGVSEALAYLHERKLIHRDIKTENILLDTQCRPKLCDFGFARSTETKEAGRPMTMCGTDEFMAPEVIFGMEYTEKADIFSLGLVLSEVISRKIVGKDDHFMERFPISGFCVKPEDLEALGSFNAPESIVLLCKECLSDEEEGRPSAEDFNLWTIDLLEELPVDVEPKPTFDEKAILTEKLKQAQHKVKAIAEDDGDWDASQRQLDLKDDAFQDRIRRATVSALEVLQREHRERSHENALGSLGAASQQTDKQVVKPKPYRVTPPVKEKLTLRDNTRRHAMSGYVQKRGNRIRSWKRRFMVTTQEGLVYFRNKEAFFKVPQVIQGTFLFEEMLPIKGGSIVAETLPFLTTGKHNAYRIMMNTRHRYLMTDDAKLTEKWVSNINAAYATWKQRRSEERQQPPDLQQFRITPRASNQTRRSRLRDRTPRSSSSRVVEMRRQASNRSSRSRSRGPAI